MGTLSELRQSSHHRAVICVLLPGCLLALCAGCFISDAYDIDEDDSSQLVPQGIPDYRMPAPPRYAPISEPIATPARTTREPPSMLRDLEKRSESTHPYRFVLDEPRKRYHRLNCPHAPRNKLGHDLEVQGDRLVAKPVLAQTGTRLKKTEIEARGYKPCQHCRPDLGKAPPWFGGQTEGYRERQALPEDSGELLTGPDARH